MVLLPALVSRPTRGFLAGDILPPLLSSGSGSGLDLWLLDLVPTFIWLPGKVQ